MHPGLRSAYRSAWELFKAATANDPDSPGIQGSQRCGELNQRNPQPPPYLFRFRLDYRGVDEISKVETNVKGFN